MLAAVERAGGRDARGFGQQQPGQALLYRTQREVFNHRDQMPRTPRDALDERPGKRRVNLCQPLNVGTGDHAQGGIADGRRAGRIRAAIQARLRR